MQSVCAAYCVIPPTRPTLHSIWDVCRPVKYTEVQGSAVKANPPTRSSELTPQFSWMNLPLTRLSARLSVALALCSKLCASRLPSVTLELVVYPKSCHCNLSTHCNLLSHGQKPLCYSTYRRQQYRLWPVAALKDSNIYFVPYLPHSRQLYNIRAFVSSFTHVHEPSRRREIVKINQSLQNTPKKSNYAPRSLQLRLVAFLSRTRASLEVNISYYFY